MTKEVELGTEIYELGIKKKVLAEEADRIDNMIKLRECDLQNLLIEEGKDSTGHINGVGEFRLKREVYPNVTNENMPRFIRYVKEIGAGAMIKETIPANTLKSHLKNDIETLTIGLEESKEKGRACVLGYVGNVYPDAMFYVQNLSEDELMGMATSELVKEILKFYGIGVFSKIGLSHTGKGK